MVPQTPAEIADEVLRCAAAEAAVVHGRARAGNGGWSADAGYYADAHRRIRDVDTDLLLSITSIRPVGAGSNRPSTAARCADRLSTSPVRSMTWSGFWKLARSVASTRSSGRESDTL